MAHLDQHKILFGRNDRGKQALRVSADLLSLLNIPKHRTDILTRGGFFEKPDEWVDHYHTIQAGEFDAGRFHFAVQKEEPSDDAAGRTRSRFTRLKLNIAFDEAVTNRTDMQRHEITLVVLPDGTYRIDHFAVGGATVPEQDTDAWPTWMHDRAYEYAAQALDALENTVEKARGTSITELVTNVRDTAEEILTGDNQRGITQWRISAPKSDPPLRKAA